jgi:hypothetical protein
MTSFSCGMKNEFPLADVNAILTSQTLSVNAILTSQTIPDSLNSFLTKCTEIGNSLIGIELNPSFQLL